MSHAHELPHIQPFTVPALGLEFVDRRILLESDPPAIRVALAAWTDRVVDQLASRGITARDVICTPDNEKLKRDSDAFHAAQDADPALTYPEWVEGGGTMERPTDLDPARPETFFCAREVATGEWVGGFTFSNIDVESDTHDGIVCGGLMVPGIPDGGNIVGAWYALFDYFLNTTLTLEDGRTLDAVEYQFLSLPELREQAPTDTDIVDFVNLMSLSFDVSSGAADSSQRTIIRRRGA